MSMPIIARPENPVDRPQAINDLIESVALMETGLSHIINAEGEKIQKVIRSDDPTAVVPIEDIVSVNNSVERMVNTIAKLEMILQNKLDISKDLDQPSDVETGITETALSVEHTTGGQLEITPAGNPMDFDTINYINGFTANATNDTFTAGVTGSYLITYTFTKGDSAVGEYNMAIKVNDQTNENTIVLYRGNTGFDEQITNSIILDLTAGDTLQLALYDLGGTDVKFINPNVGASLTIVRIA